MTKEEAIKHLKLMQSGARNAIRFTKTDKEISEENRKEDIEIYQDQLEALNMATNAVENIKALGEEHRKFREGITDEKVLIGYNMAIAICNKYLAESEDIE